MSGRGEDEQQPSMLRSLLVGAAERLPSALDENFRLFKGTMSGRGEDEQQPSMLKSLLVFLKSLLVGAAERLPSALDKSLCFIGGILSGIGKELSGLNERHPSVLKFLIVGGAVAFVAWVIAACFRSGAGSKMKTMKAPGRDFRILRAGFEKNPAGYFRGLRNK